jgi:predicted outer membrane repeat protein
VTSFSLTIIDSVFLNNNGISAAALLVLGMEDSMVLIQNCLFEGNFISSLGLSESTNGGAIVLRRLRKSHVNIVNSTFVGNSVALSNGGAIAMSNNDEDTYIEIIDCLFDGNHAKGMGGAVYGRLTTKVKLLNSIFNENVASAFGGALYFESSSPAMSLEILNNWEVEDEYISTSIDICHCTFSKNLAPSGGAITIFDCKSFRFSLVFYIIHMHTNSCVALNFLIYMTIQL